MDILNKMKEDLEQKEALLKEKQEYTSIIAEKEYQNYTFERNCISDLLTLSEIKTEIKQLKHYIMLLEISR